MQLSMVRLYEIYPPVRILKAQLYETHYNLHDRASIVRMNIPPTSFTTSLISLQQMDSNNLENTDIDYNLTCTEHCLYID